jgi:Cdc6-like AAA superfamily ATPase
MLIDKLLNDGRGVLFIDKAYQLTSSNSLGGRAILDYLLLAVENFRGKVVFVLVGYVKDIESVFVYNPSIPSRFPIEIEFADYSDKQLLSILELNLYKRYAGAIKCEAGISGLYYRIVSRRIGCGRGAVGFRNARAVENTLG